MSAPSIARDIAELIVDRARHGSVVYAAGNGGSCDQAAHLCAELMGRFCDDRPPIAAHSLCANSSTLTAIANDFGYEEVFSRQVRSMSPGDILFLLSTSGNSPNVVEAAKVAESYDVTTIGITGGGELAGLCEYGFIFAGSTAAVQEATLRTIHEICEAVDEVYHE